MPGSIPIFYSALLLTGVNLLLRFVGTTFQVYISSTLGPAGVGLLQLTMSVGSLALVAGMAGVRTATMYLTAEELGKGRSGTLRWVLSGCMGYSILLSGCVAAALYIFAPWIAGNWIRDMGTVDCLRLFAGFLPVSCLCGVMSGFFTGANRIGTLAAVEVAEQLCSMAVTLTALRFWAGNDPGRACLSVILGSCIGAAVTLCSLVVLRLCQGRAKTAPPIPLGSRLMQTAVPLAAADVVKSGINTVENLMVPRRLGLHKATQNPLAAFGLVSGMVFPVLMFPACILFALAELLIPELARCASAGSRQRIGYLVKRGLKVAMVYGLFFGGGLFLIAQPLCQRLYENRVAGQYLQLYALLVPMLYCDCITDAMTKGLGQQKACVRYNILTSALDVAGLYVLLPRLGMEGYFLSFLVTHLINFALSLGRLLKISGVRFPVAVPVLGLAGTAAAVWAAAFVPQTALRLAVYPPILLSLLYLLKVVSREDVCWLQGLVRVNSGSHFR